MNTYDYLAELALREKRAALEQKLQGMSQEQLIAFAHQRGIDVEEMLKQAGWLTTGAGYLARGGQVFNTLRGARAGLLTVGENTGGRGIAHTLGRLVSDPKGLMTMSRAVEGKLGDFGAQQFAAAGKQVFNAVKNKGSLSGLGTTLSQGASQLSKSVNQFGSGALGKTYRTGMQQKGYSVPGQGLWAWLTKPRGPFVTQ